MRIRVVAVGRVRSGPWRALLDDYAERLRRYGPFEEVELKEAPARDQAARMLREAGARAHRVALEVDGARWNSQRLARFLEARRSEGLAALVFYVGGADGLPSQLSQACESRLSLSPMTLPHRLARLVLFEQLYRAHSILAGSPYDH